MHPLWSRIFGLITSQISTVSTINICDFSILIYVFLLLLHQYKQKIIKKLPAENITKVKKALGD